MNVKPVLIAIDDQKFYLDEIEFQVHGKNLDYRPFVGSSEFEEEVSDEDVKRAKLILVDYDFGRYTAVERNIAGYIRTKFPEFGGKIVLLSLLEDVVRDTPAVRNSFDAVINKKNLTWDSIAAYLN